MSRFKVVFLLKPDESGYPPVDAEGVWVKPLDGRTARVDNIPFFVQDATLGDVIEYTKEHGEFRYVSTLLRSENSLLRLVCYPPSDPAQIRKEIESFGCETEFDSAHGLIAVSVPPDGDLEGLQRLLQLKETQGEIGYEEPILAR